MASQKLEDSLTPLVVQWDYTFSHRFLLTSKCPVSLLGRYLLSQLQATVQFGEPHKKATDQEGTFLLALSTRPTTIRKRPLFHHLLLLK